MNRSTFLQRLETRHRALLDAPSSKAGHASPAAARAANNACLEIKANLAARPGELCNMLKQHFISAVALFLLHQTA